MLNTSGPTRPGREQLSALMDGQLAPEALAQALSAWRDDPEWAADWHSFHLAADVLRSEELATAPQRDHAFLAALRARLADEPVPLATTPLLGPALRGDSAPELGLAAQAGAAASRGRGWRLRRGLMAPVAVAAGFVAVAGVLVVFRASLPAGVDGSQVAAAPAPGGSQAVPGMTVVRDARLDRYLNAHRTQGNGFTVPGAESQQVRIVYEGK